ncbi:MAG TPA: aldehyde dehydrogenase family protein [Blastocatellia bacterium]|nr:aldehyde dehydrogenase family protein [Blastocatellia bacterium]
MLDSDLQSIQSARDLIEAAHRAQAVVASFDQAKIDAICEAMAQAAQRESMRLGTLAHEETGYGVPADKNVKNLFSAVDIHNYFRNLKTVGVISDNGSVIEIAAPRGVVCAIIPSTNPTSTAIFKILISIKSRNAVVLSPHPSATRCVIETANAMRAAAVAAGLPAEAIGCVEKTTLEATNELMKHRKTAVILATGGTGLVRAAYSSGKPAFGVGPGNVPAFIEKSADVPKAVRDILAGTCFDNGTICASEQSVIVDASIDKLAREQFVAQGAVFLNGQQTDLLAKLVVTPEGKLNPKIVGKPAPWIAEQAGFLVAPNTRCLMAEIGGVGRDYPLSLEKLSPILTYYVTNGVEEGCKRCDEVLRYGGMGHTSAIHSRDRAAILRYGELMPAARIVVNSPSTHGAIGYSTALVPSMTLGCGSWGGNVTSDNISPLHLMDIKRVAFETRPVTNPNVAPATPPTTPVASVIPQIAPQLSSVFPSAGNPSPKLDRAAVADLVERFLAARQPQITTPIAPALNPQPEPPKPSAPPPAPKPQAAPFVCEDDVRRALDKGEKIYINAKTILTPSARDLGNEKNIFINA